MKASHVFVILVYFCSLAHYTPTSPLSLSLSIPLYLYLPMYLLFWVIFYIGGLVPDCSNSIALVMKLIQSWLKPSMWFFTSPFLSLWSEYCFDYLHNTFENTMIFGLVLMLVMLNLFLTTNLHLHFCQFVITRWCMYLKSFVIYDKRSVILLGQNYVYYIF